MIDFGRSDGPGPDDGTLRNLRGMLGSMAKGIAKKGIGGRGIPVRKKQPQSVCRICGRGFDIDKGREEKITTCAQCQGMINDGYSVLLSPERYAFIKSSRFKPGEQVPISEAIMERVVEECKLDAKKKGEKP